MIRIDTPADVAPALAKLRCERGATKTAVAFAVGMWGSQYGHYENGDKIPTLATLIVLAHAMGYDLALMPREDA